MASCMMDESKQGKERTEGYSGQSKSRDKKMRVVSETQGVILKARSGVEGLPAGGHFRQSTWAPIAV